MSRVGQSVSDVIFSIIPKDKSHRKEFYHIFLQQVYFTFVQSIPLLMFLGFTIGVGVSFQVEVGLSVLGRNDSVGKLIVFVLIRELAPLVCTLVMISRSVTAMTSEIATMKVQQEIQAYQIMGINIVEYILAPRVLSGMASLFCMAIAFCGFSLLGSWFGVNLHGQMSLVQLFYSISLQLTPEDIFFFICKSSFIGLAISYTGCKKGLGLNKAAFEVPIVTNQATVSALFTAFTLHAVMSGIFYLMFGLTL